MYWGDTQIGIVSGTRLDLVKHGLVKLLIDEWEKDSMGDPGQENHVFPGCVVAVEIPRTEGESSLGTPRGFYSYEPWSARFETPAGFAVNQREVSVGYDGATLVRGNEIVAHQAKMEGGMPELLEETARTYEAINVDGLKAFQRVFIRDDKEPVQSKISKVYSTDGRPSYRVAEVRPGVRTDSVVSTAMRLCVPKDSRYAFDQAAIGLSQCQGDKERQDYLSALPPDIRNALEHEAPIFSMGQTKARGGRGQRLAVYGSLGIKERIEFVPGQSGEFSLLQAKYEFSPPEGVRISEVKEIDIQALREIWKSTEVPEEFPGKQVPISRYLMV